MPLARRRRRPGRGFDRVPARGLTGGELEVARELEEVRAHRLMASVRFGVVDWGIPHGEVRWRLWQLAGDRAAAADWGCGGAWKLREARAELKAGSERAEEVWRGGAAAASSSLELRRRAVVLWGFWQGTGERATGKGCETRPGAGARASWGVGALRCAGHGSGEVAAAELAGATWRGEEGYSVQGSGSRGCGGAT